MEKTLHILLIEDNPGDVQLIREMLLDAEASSPIGVRYELEAATTLEEGITRLQRGGFHVLLLDLSLPDSKGLDTFRKVQRRFPGLPIIVLSGLDDETVAIQAVSEGGQDYLVKGRVDGDLLSRSMHYAVERKRIEEEKARIQEQLLQSQKLEAVGTLAGGVAHDFNNLMTAIQGFADVAMMKLDATHPIQRALQQIRSAAARAADLTRQMLLFSRKHPTQFTLLDFNRVIDDLLLMLHRVIGEDIHIRTSLAQDLWKIKGDRGTLEQVIMNLTLNARDAMPNGGVILIRTENVRIDEAFVKTHPEAHPGRYVRLSVTDEGIGIPEEIKERIFEPFFSTKGPGKGTGLGLSACYGIVKQHDGFIEVRSKVGEGSTFEIYLPAHEGVEVQEQVEALQRAEAEGDGRRILLVEDSEAVREFADLALTENGFRVYTAETGNEAIGLFDAEGPFDLVITDVVLPDQSGLDLIQHLLLKHPGQRVLISSGYTDQKSQWPVIQEKGYRFLQKPYAYSDLLKAVREAMEGS